MIALNPMYGARKLRVAHVSLGLNVGGAEKLQVEFARHADRDRFELCFVSLTERGKLASLIEDAGWPVIAMKEPGGVRPGLLWRLTQLFRRRHIDIVHTHDDKPLVYAVPAARLAGATRVIHTHHHGLLSPVSRAQQLAIEIAARMSDAFVCVSHDAARHMTEEGVPRSKLQVLWNGIDTTRFAFEGPRPDGPIVTVGRLIHDKNICLLIDALARVVARRPGTCLEIAGDGPVRGELEAQIASLNLQENVRFLGEVKDVPAVLRRASLFVLPSRTEGISLTILEAMARGLPVVACRVGGNPEIVAHGSTGLLVTVNKPIEMAYAIQHILDDPATGRALGHAGRQRVEEHFNVRTMVRRYEAMYAPQSRSRSRQERLTNTVQATVPWQNT